MQVSSTPFPFSRVFPHSLRALAGERPPSPHQAKDSDATEPKSMSHPLDGVMTAQTRLWYDTILFKLKAYLYSAYKVDDPASTLHETSVVLIDLAFDPTRVGTHPVREQFNPLSVWLFSQPDVFREMYPGRLARAGAERREHLYQMSQKGLDEFHGLKTMPADVVRCGAYVRVFPPKQVEFSDAPDLHPIPISIRRTHADRTRGAGPRPWGLTSGGQRDCWSS